MEKYINEEGQVGVLISKGYGCGWSSWKPDDRKAYYLMDKGLVELALNGASEEEAKQYLSALFEDSMACSTGWFNVEVIFLDAGTVFEIDCFDGNEMISFVDNEYFCA